MVRMGLQTIPYSSMMFYGSCCKLGRVSLFRLIDLVSRLPGSYCNHQDADPSRRKRRFARVPWQPLDQCTRKHPGNGSWWPFENTSPHRCEYKNVVIKCDWRLIVELFFWGRTLVFFGGVDLDVYGSHVILLGAYQSVCNLSEWNVHPIYQLLVPANGWLFVRYTCYPTWW